MCTIWPMAVQPSSTLHSGRVSAGHSGLARQRSSAIAHTAITSERPKRNVAGPIAL